MLLVLLVRSGKVVKVVVTTGDTVAELANDVDMLVLEFETGPGPGAGVTVVVAVEVGMDVELLLTDAALVELETSGELVELETGLGVTEPVEIPVPVVIGGEYGGGGGSAWYAE